MDNNIHIISLRYGYEHQTGFNYNDLKDFLINTEQIEFTFELEFAFRIWFSEAFFNPNIEDDVNYRKLNPSSGFSNLYKQNLLPFDNSNNTISGTNSFMTGASVIQYLDYLELKEARDNSIAARKYSTTSIIIACFAIIIPIVSAYFFPTSVRIINPQDQKGEYNSNSSRDSFLMEDSILIKTIKKLKDTTNSDSSEDSLNMEINKDKG